MPKEIIDHALVADLRKLVGEQADRVATLEQERDEANDNVLRLRRQNASSAALRDKEWRNDKSDLARLRLQLQEGRRILDDLTGSVRGKSQLYSWTDTSIILAAIDQARATPTGDAPVADLEVGGSAGG